MSYKRLFTRFFANASRLHFAAHSHHYWPDASFEAHSRAWLDAAAFADTKWDRVFGEVVPTAQRHIARTLSLSRPEDIAFAPSTHEFLGRLFSTFPTDRPVRILATDGEFHSFVRQSRRWEEAGRAVVERVPVEPFDTFPQRFQERVRAGGYDWLFYSQVFFNSGYFFREFAEMVREVPGDEALVLIDGYHGFSAIPTDLSQIEARAFYTSGGYKYAMTGEGVCFLHCPRGYAPRPVDTGWFAGFEELEKGADIAYADDGMRMWGATFDPTGLYRFNAVMDLWQQERVSVADIHDHVGRLQERFLDQLDEMNFDEVNPRDLVPGREFSERGHFLTFRRPNARELRARLLEHDVVTDARADRLRFGFGIYHDFEDLDALGARLRTLLG